jgi:hypothetical protein
VIASHTTSDGFTLRVFSSLYLDYGLEILYRGESVFYGPCHLSAEHYGHSPAGELSWEEAEAADSWEAWTPKDWEDCLRDDAWELVDGFLGPDWLDAFGGAA